MRLASILIGFLIFACDIAMGQFYENIYRPSQPQWQQLNTPHFKIIYQQGEDSTAMYTARILESQYHDIQKLVGGELRNLPVVLNGYNDQANGYVTPMHFRIEVEIPTIKGKTLNPGGGGWLETVMPHELVHALHMSVNPPWGITSLMNIFSPDNARAFHLIAPSGMLEGIAVYHESDIRPGLSGRGNHPYFTNRFNANLAERNNWGMGDMHFPPGRSRPFNRHYIGGHEFTSWLLDDYGLETTRDNINLMARWPFFGYGFTLKRTTGKWPSQLYREFSLIRSQEEDQRLAEITKAGRSRYDLIDTRYAGPDLNRPLWLNNEEIIFYGSFYNRRPGFWKYNLQTGDQEQVYETRTVGDFMFDLSPDRNSLLYSRYHSHPYYHNTWLMDVHELSIHDANSQRLTRQARIHAPVYSGDSIWALQTHHETSQWVSIDGQGSPSPLLSLRPDNIVEIRPNPVGTEIAVVANRNGIQALWLVNAEDNDLPKQPLVHLPEASIFDLAWHPDGDKLMFSADYEEAMNLFEYTVESSSLVQITNSLYNAYEGSYSPDGSKIAYISQEGNYRRIAIMYRKDFMDRTISREVWDGSAYETDSPRLGDELLAESGSWESSSYRTGMGWLRPRGFYPYYESASDIGHRFGVSIASGDVLRRHSYLGTLSTSNNRLWYDASYRYSGFFPGFRVNMYNEPVQTSSYLLEERGAGIRVPINITTASNTRLSGFTLTPGFRSADVRIIDRTGEALSEWQGNLVGSLFAVYNHRLQQNIRDAQPNTGISLFAQNELRRNFDDSWTQAIRTGISVFSAPLQRFNQSLRLGAEVLAQNGPGIGTGGFASEGFSENVLWDLDNAYSLKARYTMPLWNPDRAGLLIPAQVERFYAVVFANTVGPLDNNDFDHFITQSRSVYGLGLRMGFGLFNARFDIGMAVGYEPSRDAYNLFIGIF